MTRNKATTISLQRRHLVILAFFLLVNYSSFAQSSYTPPTTTGYSRPEIHSDDSTRFFLGFGTGVNNYVGIIGIGVDFRVYKTFYLRAGAGIGTWGTKLSIAARYEINEGKGWVLGLTYCRCSGLNNFQTQLVVDTSTLYSSTVTRQVTLNLNPASSVNLTASYNWIFHKHHKFYLEFGYAVALQTAPYQVLDGSILDSSSKAALNILSPGGIVLDCGFMFGL
jgi:hypothetical protein